MKNTLIYFIIISVFISCKPNRNNENDNEIKKREVITEHYNSIDYGLEKLKTIDEFFYMFMLVPEVQKNQIKYPIEVNHQIIETKADWRYIPFFSKKGAIASLESDTIIKVKNSNIKIIDLKKRTFINYQFEKSNKNWMLIKLKYIDYSELKKDDFFDFFQNFSKNKTFQKEHIKFPLKFVFANSEKDYETDTLVKKKDNWEHIKLVLDLLQIENNDIKSDYRILSFSGVENGVAVEFVFKRINKIWYLIKYFDFST